MNVNSINQVFSTYETLKDSIKVTRRSIDKSIDVLHNKTLFFAEQKDKTMNQISLVETELDDIMILSLFASFERELRVSVQNIIDLSVNKSNPIIIKFIELTSESIERWAIKDIIDAFEGIVDENIRSKTKQIYEYRNWVAHGKNPDKLPSTRTDPKVVFITLSDFASQVSSVM